jgi:hypothetical protein
MIIMGFGIVRFAARCRKAVSPTAAFAYPSGGRSSYWASLHLWRSLKGCSLRCVPQPHRNLVLAHVNVANPGSEGGHMPSLSRAVECFAREKI